jgi:hypothetical protein
VIRERIGSNEVGVVEAGAGLGQGVVHGEHSREGENNADSHIEMYRLAAITANDNHSQ